MKTTFTTSELIDGVATYNADPFCIEDEDMAQEIIGIIDEFGCRPVCDDELDDAKAKLDIIPDDDSWDIYEAGNECLFAIHKREHEIYVSFHVGRGGRFHNPGYITFIAEIDFQELIARRSDNLILCDTIWDEENDKEVALADEGWQMVDTGSNVILRGRKAIEAKKGVLEFDTIYDKDYTITLDECDEKEWDALRYAYEKPLERYGMSEDLQREIREYFDLNENDDDDE